jgi:chromosome segregation ATPase
MTHKVVLDQDSYKQMKAQGKSDAEISRDYGIKQPTLAYYKKKWFGDAAAPEKDKAVEIVKKQIPEVKTVIVNEDKKEEYERLISALRKDLNESHKQLEDKDETIRDLKETIEKYQNINYACEDVENELSSVREELNQVSGMNEMLVEANKGLQQVIERQREENTALKNLLRLML